jgi:death on curing protein
LPPTRWIPTFEDYLDVAAIVLDATEASLRSLPRVGLAESALHAPFATFGGVDAHPELIDQAAILLVHLVRNHALPDGNKRVGFLVMAMFLARNGRAWAPEDVDRDAGMVERVASGEASIDDVAGWIRTCTTGRG